MRVQEMKQAVERYVSRVLHTDLDLHDLSNQGALPTYLTHAYDLNEGRLAGRSVIFMLRDDDDGTPAEMAKHVAIVHEKCGEPVVLVLNRISANYRSRLVEMAVPFIVPDNQLYLPPLALDFREHFPAPKARAEGKLTPVSQAVLFYHLLDFDHEGLTSSELAQRLHYTPMSIGRALDELTERGLASAIRFGRERHIRFEKPRRELFEQAKNALRSPVKRVVGINRDADVLGFKLAGEAALSRLSALSHPHRRSYACTGDQWKELQARDQVKQVPEVDAETILEIWSYDPTPLASEWVVDPLSLYAQFWNDRDERVAMAADNILETVHW